MSPRSAADRMLSAASRRKTVLSVAASSALRGGAIRVFVLPGIDALPMTAIAHLDRKCDCQPSPADGLIVFPRRATVNLANPPTWRPHAKLGRVRTWVPTP